MVESLPTAVVAAARPAGLEAVQAYLPARARLRLARLRREAVPGSRVVECQLPCRGSPASSLLQPSPGAGSPSASHLHTCQQHCWR